MTPSHSQGDVILIAFPYTNFSQLKKRPTLIISADWYNRLRKDIIVLPISSKIPIRPKRDDYVLSQRDQRAAGLPKPSVIKLGKVMTLEKRFVLETMGRLPEENLRKVLRRFLDVVGI